MIIIILLLVVCLLLMVLAALGDKDQKHTALKVAAEGLARALTDLLEAYKNQQIKHSEEMSKVLTNLAQKDSDLKKALEIIEMGNSEPCVKFYNVTREGLMPQGEFYISPRMLDSSIGCQKWNCKKLLWAYCGRGYFKAVYCEACDGCSDKELP